MSRQIISGASPLTFESKLDQRFSVQDTGMVPDCLQGTNGSMAVGSNVLTISGSDPALSSAYVGKPIVVYGAGPTLYSNSRATLIAGNQLLATIVSVSSNGLSITLSASCTSGVSTTQWACGTDNTLAFNHCIDALRTAGGGILNWDKPGDYFFASAGWVGPFTDNYVDRIDFDNCHIIQGEHTKIVLGYPMGFLEFNQTNFNKWTLVTPDPPTASINTPVAKGDYLIKVSASQMVDSSGNSLFNRGDYILIYTGYIGNNYFGFNLPDAQICQVVFGDITNGQIILSEPVLKPFAQENYPTWTNTGPTGPAPFAVMNVTDIIIKNFRYVNLNLNSFFLTDVLVGGQMTGLYLDNPKINCKGSPHVFNYVRHSVGLNPVFVIDNLGSPKQPFDYAWTFAVGSSYCSLLNPTIISTGTTFLHIHEGASNCTVRGGSISVFNGNADSFGIQPVSIRGRSYGLVIDGTRFNGFDSVGIIYIESTCTHGGLISNVHLTRSTTVFYGYDIENFGQQWRLDVPLTSPGRVYQLSTNLQPPILAITDGNLKSLEATNGFSSALGGFGRSGNLITSSNDLTAIPWNHAVGVTVTPNTTDIQDPLGGHTASKITTGPTSAQMEVSFFLGTPAAGVVTGSGTNGGRSFKFVFYVYSTSENRMECYIASYTGTGVDINNRSLLKIPVFPVWQRIELLVTYDASAGSHTAMLCGVASGATNPVVGTNSTFYVWGCTCQEFVGPQVLVTQTTGTRVAYASGLYPVPSGGGTSLPVVDSTNIVKGSSDPTKLMRLDVSSLASGALRVVSVPNEDVTITKNAHLSFTQNAGQQNLTTTVTPIANAATQLDRNGDWEITGTYTFGSTKDSGGAFGYISVDGVIQTPDVATSQILTANASDALVQTVSTSIIITNTGFQVIRLQGKKGANAGTAFATNCRVTAKFLHP